MENLWHGLVSKTKSNLDRGLKQTFYRQVFLEVSRFKNLNDSLLCSIRILDSIQNEQSLYTTIGKNENDLERGSVTKAPAKFRFNNRPYVFRLF